MNEGYEQPQTIDFRILYRQGPGDTYKVIQRRVPVARDFTLNVPQHAERALRDLSPSADGHYLVQCINTHEVRAFRVNTRPVIMEL